MVKWFFGRGKFCGWGLFDEITCFGMLQSVIIEAPPENLYVSVAICISRNGISGCSTM